MYVLLCILLPVTIVFGLDFPVGSPNPTSDFVSDDDDDDDDDDSNYVL